MNGNPTIAASLRFWKRVVKTDSCWIWSGATNRQGYGRIKCDGRSILAHRFAYEAVVGPIPEGLQLDHLCMNKGCVRPDHLEPVTAKENMARASAAGLLSPQRDSRRGHKTHCPYGHPYEGRNLILGSDGKRRCRQCALDRKLISLHGPKRADA